MLYECITVTKIYILSIDVISKTPISLRLKATVILDSAYTVVSHAVSLGAPLAFRCVCCGCEYRFIKKSFGDSENADFVQ